MENWRLLKYVVLLVEAEFVFEIIKIYVYGFHYSNLPNTFDLEYHNLISEK